jgi:hypothetical protein
MTSLVPRHQKDANCSDSLANTDTSESFASSCNHVALAISCLLLHWGGLEALGSRQSSCQTSPTANASQRDSPGAAVGSGLGKDSKPVRASGGRCERRVAKRRGPVYGWIPPAGGSSVDRGGGRKGAQGRRRRQNDTGGEERSVEDSVRALGITGGGYCKNTLI